MAKSLRTMNIHLKNEGQEYKKKVLLRGWILVGVGG
jgi:hypothetical protein